MRLRPARRLGVLTTSLLLTVGLIAPTAASAGPSGSAATLGERGSVLSEQGSVRASANTPIKVRDLSFACPKGRVMPAGFSDVPSSYPFAKAIDCLVWYEITQGKTWTDYAPNDSVTRQQMAVFIYRTLEYLGIADFVEPPRRSQFSDVPATGEAGRAINVLASEELADWLGVQIVTGKTATTFDPRGEVTRAQMGSFIARTLEGVAEVSGATLDRGRCDNVFPDERDIPSAHRANVKLLCAFGIVAGRADGTYGPAADVTRGQMSAFLMRLMDLFVEARITLPPDAFAEVYVDRGTEACSATGRDGSSSKPFCTIQAGVNAARKLSGFAVAVVVRDRAAPYAESVVLSSGQAFSVELVSERFDKRVKVDGSIRIDGARTRDFNVVAGFDVTSPTAAPALDVRTAGMALIVEGAADAPTGVRVDQQGLSWIIDLAVTGSSVGIDLVNTYLEAEGWGTFLADNDFGPSAEAYIRAPGTVSNSVANANLEMWLDDFDNTFPPGAKLGASGGRRAIVPA